MQIYIFCVCILVSVAPNLSGQSTNGVRSVQQFVAHYQQPGGVVDYQHLWKDLRVQSSLFSEKPTYAITTVTGAGSAWKLIKLSDSWKDSWQYLVFQKDKKGVWSFEGNIDFPKQHYEEPVVRVTIIDGHAWLVIQHVAGSGTGIFIRKESWYSSTQGKERCELTYLLDGRFTQTSNEAETFTEYERTSISTAVSDGKPMVMVKHRVVRKLLTGDDTEKVLNLEEIGTSFVWSKDKQHFVPVKPVRDTQIIE